MALQLGMPNLSLQRQFGGGDGSLEGNDGLTTGTFAIANSSPSMHVAQKVVADSPHNIESITIAASKVGSPTGDVSIAIYSHDEGLDVPDALIGTASGTIDKSTCPGTEDTWEFTGLDVDILSDTYWIVVICPAYDAANHMLWAYTAAQTDGNSTVQGSDGSLWSSLSTVTTMKYKVFGTALDIAAPATPANFVALLSETAPQIDLSWDAAVGAEQYTVEYKPTLGSTWVAATTTLETTSYTMLALDPGKSYDFRILATAFAGTSGASNIETAVADGYIRHAFIENDPFDEHLFADYLTGLWSVTSWAADYDFTGVSWETDDVASGAVHKDEQRATLIGRDCFVCAYHWAPAVGTMLTFTDAAGTKFDYEVATRSDEITVGGYTYDGCVGTLTEVVSDTLTSYAIEEDAYIDQYLVSTRSRFSETVEHPSSQQAMIERVSGWSYGSEPSPDAQWFVAGAPGTGIPADVAVNRFTADNGDSGDPLFTYRDGKLKVYSTYHGTQNGPYLGFPTMLSQIDAFLALQGTEREAFSLPPRWWTDDSVSDLLMAYDFRGVDGASDIFLDVNSKLWIASDLSGRGHDYEAISAGSSVNPSVNAAVDGGGVRLSQPENNKLYSTTRAARGMSTTEDDHTFVVLKMRNAKAIDDTTKALGLINISGNGGNNPKVLFSNAGGAAVFGSYDAYEYWTSNGNVLKGGNVNLSSLTGRAETDAVDRYALVEIRRDEVASRAQVWVNGFLVAEDTTVSSSTAAGYDYIGMATLDYEADIFAWATGDILTTGFTLEQAAAVRAALMADYGIEVWDGATYPQPDPPAAPANFTATANAAASKVDTTWDASTGADTYKVEYKESTSSTWLVAAAAEATTSYQVTGLDFATNYDFRVTATSVYGDSDPSTTASATTGAGASLVYEWVAPDPATQTGYRVETATDSGFTNIVDTTYVGASALTATITGLLFNDDHWGRVIPFNGAGDGAPATFEAGYANPFETVPDVAVISAAQGTGSDVVLTVTEPVGPNSGAASYKVYYKKSADPTYTAGETGASSPITVTGLDGETDYDFYVLATSSGGDGLPSNVETLETGAVASYTLEDSNTSTLNLAGLDIGYGASRTYGATHVTTNSSGYTATKLEVPLKKEASPTAGIAAKIWADNADEPGTLLATSTNTVDSSLLTTDYADAEFLFAGVALSASTKYWIGLVSDDVSFSNYVKWSLPEDFVSNGNIRSEDGAAWNAGTAKRANYKLYSGGS